ncbi:helix-turn-helix domain-containing protein [Corynebacterium kalidii]
MQHQATPHEEPHEARKENRVTPVVYKTADFCKAYGISRQTFDKHVAAGRLNPKRIGKEYRIHRDEAERWFESLPDYEPPNVA